ncbi:MAG: ABC transporter permease [Candidatus Methanomethylicia archaeon]|jgi:ABC-2 type transport system permease protein|nr:ABC transporter permease [Candidatus Methanomethylicia archaeon]MCQ5373435.1 ABC transporter permease [Candidatus Methanomethylicia archaeon]
MSELSGLYALWYREVKVFLRERSRIISSIVNPIIWLVAFGGGLGSTISFGGADYQTFIFPGVLMLTVLFTSIFFGLYIVWDKRMDFFKEVMVAPLSRLTLFTGKMMGGCTDSLLQGSFLIIIGLFFNIKYTLYSLVLVIIFLLFLSAATTSLGLAIGAQLSSFEGFGLIQSFVIMPLFFLSGALYPLENLPEWLLIVTRVNPLTYIVDGMRGALLGLNHFPLWMDLGAALAFMVAMILAGTLSFMRMH